MESELRPSVNSADHLKDYFIFGPKARVRVERQNIGMGRSICRG